MEKTIPMIACMVRPACLPLVALLVLAGCATYQPQPLAPQETARAFAARSFDDPKLIHYIEEATGAPSPAPWDFSHLTLVAAYYQPELRVAAARWNAARANVLAAGARPNPEASPSVQRNLDAAAGTSPWTLGLDLSFPLETAGKRGDRMAQAQHEADAARLRLADTFWQVRSRLRRRLLALYQAQRSSTILARLEAAQARYVALLEQRQAAGELSSFELTQTRIALDDTRLKQRAAERQAAVALARVADALGVPTSALASVNIALTLFDHPALAADALGPELRAHALRERPDVLAALADYAAAEAALKLEVARQYPDLQLGPGYLWDQGERKWSVMLGFALPVNRNAGLIAVARARREEAAARFLALQDGVSGLIDAAVADYDAALKQLDTANALATANAAQQRLLARRLRPGVLSALAAINAEIAVAHATAARLEALVQTQQAFGGLEDAVQQPLDPLEALPPRARTMLPGAPP